MMKLTFTNFKTSEVILAVEPWAQSFVVAPGEEVEISYKMDPGSRESPIVEVCPKDDAITIVTVYADFVSISGKFGDMSFD